MLTYRNIKVDGSRVYNHSNAALLRNNSSHNTAVYEKQVVLLLQMLDRNSVGYLLLERIEESIRRSGHPMRIVPWDDAHQAAGGADILSADRGPIDRQQRMNIVRATTSPGVETSHSSDVEHGEMGTGTGWAAVVMIDPTRLRNSPLSGVAGQPMRFSFMN